MIETTFNVMRYCMFNPASFSSHANHECHTVQFVSIFISKKLSLTTPFKLIYFPCLLQTCKSAPMLCMLKTINVIFSNYGTLDMVNKMHVSRQKVKDISNLEPESLGCFYFIAYRILFHQVIIYISKEIDC